MHPAKRSRTDNTASSLNKPFRSPLHVDPTRQKTSHEKRDDQNSQANVLTTPTQLPGNNEAIANSLLVATLTTSSQIQRSSTRSSPIRRTRPQTSNYDQEYVALQKQHSALTLQLKELTTSFDSATQALKIAQSHKDDDLKHLITKWRAASRDAAEELFSTAKDHVNHMGGVAIWREKCLQPYDQNGWADEPEIDENELTTEQKEQLEIVREEARLESEKYGLNDIHPLADVKDDDSFTIDTMLKQLNVDLEAIGYDTQAQRWSD